ARRQGQPHGGRCRRRSLDSSRVRFATLVLWMLLACSGDRAPVPSHDPLAVARTPRRSSTPAIRGTVRDAKGAPVGGVDVVFRDAAGAEQIAKTGADGTYQLTLATGSYRASVRAPAWLSIGRP